MELVCSRCGLNANDADQLDWCATCEASLCAPCMDFGCCNSKPAQSGRDRFTEFQKAPAPPPEPVVQEEPQGLPEIYVAVTERHPCCVLAVRRECSCAMLWSCPVHGKKHVGRHD